MAGFFAVVRGLRAKFKGFHTCGRRQGLEGEVLHAVRGQEASDAVHGEALVEEETIAGGHASPSKQERRTMRARHALPTPRRAAFLWV